MKYGITYKIDELKLDVTPTEFFQKIELISKKIISFGFESKGSYKFFISNKDLNLADIYKLIEELKQDKGFVKALINFEVFRIEQTSDFLDILKAK